MITYREISSAFLGEIKEIYSQAGWTAYLNDSEKLKRAFDRSLFLLGAFDGPVLAGFVRCIGDGEHVLLVQDLIVREEYRRQGIGHALFRTVWDKWCSVRMFQANTDASDPTANRFYRSFGMKKLEEGGMTGYYR